MISLGGVSKRTKTIYERYYAADGRDAQRYENLYIIFDRLAAHVAAANLNAKLEIDYASLAEIVRSYFFDVIRYKEYHFDPKSPEKSELVYRKLQEFGYKSLEELDPLSPEWSELVHTSVNINASKVAAYTAKWILKYKPISVVSTRSDITRISDAGIHKVPLFLSYVNEEFALQCALFALQISVSDVSSRKLDELIYCFRFRNFDESAYFMILTRDYLCSTKAG